MIELDIEHSQVPSVQPRHEAPLRLRPPQRSRVAGAQNTNTIKNTKQTRIIQNTRPPLVYFPSLLMLIIDIHWSNNNNSNYIIQ
jgi:hypothetical protein